MCRQLLPVSDPSLAAWSSSVSAESSPALAELCCLWLPEGHPCGGSDSRTAATWGRLCQPREHRCRLCHILPLRMHHQPDKKTSGHSHWITDWNSEQVSRVSSQLHLFWDYEFHGLYQDFPRPLVSSWYTVVTLHSTSYLNQGIRNAVLCTVYDLWHGNLRHRQKLFEGHIVLSIHHFSYRVVASLHCR